MPCSKKLESLRKRIFNRHAIHMFFGAIKLKWTFHGEPHHKDNQTPNCNRKRWRFAAQGFYSYAACPYGTYVIHVRSDFGNQETSAISIPLIS